MSNGRFWVFSYWDENKGCKLWYLAESNSAYNVACSIKIRGKRPIFVSRERAQEFARILTEEDLDDSGKAFQTVWIN